MSKAYLVILFSIHAFILFADRSSGDYVAAVYEQFTHSSLQPIPNATYEIALEIMNENLDVYEKQMLAASQKGAQIIVFPEYGITGFFSTPEIEVFLEDVPIPYSKFLNPCDQVEFKDRPILQRLSCLAKKYQMVLVVNMASKVQCKHNANAKPCPKRGYFQYNTNVAFSDTGQILAKYNKINVYAGEKEIFDSPESSDLSNYGIFNTSFGIFGMFTCFDILFSEPAVNLVHGIGITDMVFPTAWINELPLLSAVEIQEAWSIRFNVPLLAANQHLPSEQMTGSGIYNGQRGHVVYHYDMISTGGHLLVGKIQRHKQSTLRQNIVTKLIGILTNLSTKQVQNVHPLMLEMLENGNRKSLTEFPKQWSSISQTFPPVSKQTVDVSTFQAIMNDDLYTFIPLTESIGEIHITTNNITCQLNYSRKPGGKDQYALGAFDGWHTENGRYYVQACALVRCPFGNWTNCGQETNYSGSLFHYFSLQMFGMSQTLVIFPEVVTSWVNLAQVGTEWRDDCPVCSWVYSNSGVSKPLLTAGLFGRDWELG